MMHLSKNAVPPTTMSSFCIDVIMVAYGVSFVTSRIRKLSRFEEQEQIDALTIDLKQADFKR